MHTLEAAEYSGLQRHTEQQESPDLHSLPNLRILKAIYKERRPKRQKRQHPEHQRDTTARLLQYRPPASFNTKDSEKEEETGPLYIIPIYLWRQT
jgi:hypothetical protein